MGRGQGRRARSMSSAKVATPFCFTRSMISTTWPYSTPLSAEITACILGFLAASLLTIRAAAASDGSFSPFSISSPALV